MSHLEAASPEPELRCVFLCVDAFLELAQFGPAKSQFGETTIQTNQEFRKGPDGPCREIVKSGDVNINFAKKRGLVL